ncbi:hypothetical protein RR47_GL001006 [Enterococcus columbae DSM 7374 = ATCC 51263]|nr:hypothetical protein RR47_GL001006 [Enterococcus columbae DSM 7374 = ATCC 51263]
MVILFYAVRSKKLNKKQKNRLFFTVILINLLIVFVMLTLLFVA